MKKRFFALFLISLLLMGCVANQNNDGYVPTGDAILMEGQDPEDLVEEEVTQELTLAYYPDRSMNPLIGNNITNRVLFSLIYQGLFATDSGNNTYPILCSHYEVSADNKSFTVYLDPNATFSDGTTVTAQDVLATYEAAKVSDYYKGRFTLITFELVSSDAICFHTSTAYENLALLLDVPIVKASEVNADFPLGTGPYFFQQGTNNCSLVRVSNWWCGKTKVPARANVISLMVGTSQSQIRDAFEFENLSLACANPMTDSFSEYRCDYELWNVENGMFLYLSFNVQYSDFFNTDDHTLRQAMTYAIDRDYINETYYNGLCQPSTLPTSPGSPYYNESLASRYDHDDMKFIDAINGLKLPTTKNLEQVKLKLLVNCDDSARLRTARYIAQHLTDLGIDTGVLEYGGSTSPTYEEVLLAGTYDMVLAQTKLPPTYDLGEFFRPWGNLGYGWITDGTLYNMSNESLANEGNYYSLNQMVADDAKIVPILFGTYCIYAERGELLDLSPSRDNVFFYTVGKTMESAKVSDSQT